MDYTHNKKLIFNSLGIRLFFWLILTLTIVTVVFAVLVSRENKASSVVSYRHFILDTAETWRSVSSSPGDEKKLEALLSELEYVDAVKHIDSTDDFQTDDDRVVLVRGGNGAQGFLVLLNIEKLPITPVLTGSSLLLIVVICFLLLLITVFVFNLYSSYLSRLIDFFSERHSEDRPVVFTETSTVDEFEALRKQMNYASEKIFMQSLAVKRSFDELARFSQMLEFSPVLIACFNTNMDVTYVNKAVRNSLTEKYNTEDVMLLLPEQINERIDNCLLENEMIQGLESVYEGKYFMWSIVPLPAENEVNCFGVDITRIRQAESETESAYVDSMKARDESEAKSVFLANMSHEIRTPLTAILGFSEALLDSSQPMEERVVGINTIIRNAKHLLSIINDLLDITKIESGLSVISLQPASLKNILVDVNQNYTAQARARNIEFKVDIRYPIPEMIVSDELRLRQILFNVCTNAIKFTGQGAVTMQVDFDERTDELSFVISDTGIGMSEAEIQYIFNRFEQSDSSHSRKYGGSGLGLYICKELAERLDGSISVSSERGKGSQFKIVIKARPAAETAYLDEDFVAVDIEETVEHEKSQYRGQVLLVEDNIDNQNLIKMYLTRLGVSVEVANNGKEAFEKTRGCQFDLILMDMQMPVMDGVEATIKIIESGCVSPIVMLTANAMSNDIQTCRSAGCTDVLIKPVRRQEFEKKVIEYLQPEDDKEEQLQPIVSELVNEGPEFYNIVKAYVKQLPGDLEAVRQAYVAGDDELLKKCVHSMKGTSGNMGFLDFSQLCAKVEFAITKNDREEISMLLGKLEDMKLRIIAGIENE